jgi:hypothetical protein
MALNMMKAHWDASVVCHLLDRKDDVHIGRHQMPRRSDWQPDLVYPCFVIAMVAYKGCIREIVQCVLKAMIDTNRLLAV